MNEPSKWEQIVAANPSHSRNYIERFKAMAAQGTDLVGEARLVDAMAPRRAHILDAGCGPGRHAGHLHALGHRVVGVDVDPELIAAAEQDAPGPTYLVGNLDALDLPAEGITDPFDVILCGGNVMTFLAPSTRREVLRRFAAHLDEKGRAVIGFGAGRGYDFGEFVVDAEHSDLRLQLALESWDLRPFEEDSTFFVGVFSRA